MQIHTWNTSYIREQVTFDTYNTDVNFLCMLYLNGTSKSTVYGKGEGAEIIIMTLHSFTSADLNIIISD